jgi:hypothetical protein
LRLPNRAIPLGHYTKDYEKRLTVYDKKGIGKGIHADKETIIVQVKNGNSINLSDF